MKKNRTTYLFFYFSFFIIICVAAFFDKYLLIYIKPVVPLSLVVLYFKFVQKPNILFPVCMFIVTITDVFVYLDFVRYYTVIGVLISLFYATCVFLLKNFISKKDIKLKALTSPAVIVSTILIGYLLFSIIELVLPKIINSLSATVLIITSLFLFVTVCFFIYVADRYEKSIYLFIAACCTLFVDALLAINELYYYTRVFTILINITEIVGIYFFTIFFVYTKSISKNILDDKYF